MIVFVTVKFYAHVFYGSTVLSFFSVVEARFLLVEIVLDFSEYKTTRLPPCFCQIRCLSTFKENLRFLHMVTILGHKILKQVGLFVCSDRQSWVLRQDRPPKKRRLSCFSLKPVCPFAPSLTPPIAPARHAIMPCRVHTSRSTQVDTEVPRKSTNTSSGTSSGLFVRSI